MFIFRSWIYSCIILYVHLFSCLFFLAHQHFYSDSPSIVNVSTYSCWCRIRTWRFSSHANLRLNLGFSYGIRQQNNTINKASPRQYLKAGSNRMPLLRQKIPQQIGKFEKMIYEYGSVMMRKETDTGSYIVDLDSIWMCRPRWLVRWHCFRNFFRRLGLNFTWLLTCCRHLPFKWFGMVSFKQESCFRNSLRRLVERNSVNFDWHTTWVRNFGKQ